MGIDLAIKNTILAPSQKADGKRVESLQWAADAWVLQRFPTTPFAWIDDFLIRFKAIDTAKTYTTIELFRRFWEPVRLSLLQRHVACTTYVLICDDRVNVSARKGATQQKRVEAANKSDASHGLAIVVPYASIAVDDEGHIQHAEWTLVEGGILHCVNGEKRVDEIDLRRLRASDKTGKRLWNAFVPLIQEAMANDCPFGRSFVFDFDDSTNALWFDSDGHVTKGDNHNLGEADPAIIWWTHFLSTNKTNAPDWQPPQIHIRTTDTDVIPLYCLYHETSRLLHRASSVEFELTATNPEQCYEGTYMLKGQGIFWHPNMQKGFMIELGAMAEGIKRNAKGMTLRHFAFFCIACGGCDYVPAEAKAQYARGFGAAKILAAVQHCLPLNMDDPALAFRAFVQHLYNLDYSKNTHARILTMDRMRELYVHSKSKSVPTEDMLLKWSSEVAFNFAYWERAYMGVKTL